MRTIPLVALIFAIAAPAAVLAQFASPNVTYVAPAAGDMIALVNLRHAGQLETLRDEGVRLRQADGGTLTPAHRAELQMKLDRVESSYRAGVRRYDLLIVDSLGRPR